MLDWPDSSNHAQSPHLNLVGLVTFERQGFKVATIPVACLIDGFFFQCARAVAIFIIGDFFLDHIKFLIGNIHQSRTDMGMVLVSLDKSCAKMHRNMTFDGRILVDGGCIEAATSEEWKAASWLRVVQLFPVP